MTKRYAEQDRLDPVAMSIVQYLMNDEENSKILHVLALEIVVLTEEEFVRLSEEDDDNPRVQLYWATVTNLIMKALARAGNEMSHYSDLERVPFYKTIKHVSEIFQTINLGAKYHVTYNTANGGRRHRHGVLARIDGPRNMLTFNYTDSVGEERDFDVHCSQIIRAVNEGRDHGTWNSYENGEKD